METFLQYCRWIVRVVEFSADLVTLVLGAIALWALVFHRRKLGLVFRVLVSGFLNERVKRIKETLGKLESLNYDNKPDRPEIIALLGQISGQIKPLTTDGVVHDIHVEMLGLLEKRTSLSEATKRRVTYELHGALDNISFASMQTVLEEKQK